MTKRWFRIEWGEANRDGWREEGKLWIGDDGETREEDAKDRRHQHIQWTEGKLMRKGEEKWNG